MLIILLAALWVFNEMGRPPQAGQWPPAKETSATVLQEPMDVPAFTLTDQNGEAFTTESLRGKWTFLFFGYTYCPDVCPTTLTILGQVRKMLEEDGVSPLPHTVFVSVDPKRDGQSGRLAGYTSHFHPDFLGVTGDEQELQALTRPMGIFYAKATTKDTEESYSVDHSAAILLINPDGRLLALMTPPHNVNDITSDYVKLSAKYGPSRN